MILLNPYGIEVEVNDYVLRTIKNNGTYDRYKQLPCKVPGNGPTNYICLLLGNNGIGDDIHAMPALRQKILDGYTIDVYSREFTRECYESIGCNFFPYISPDIGFVQKNIDKYGAIYHLSQWCMRHDHESNGDVHITRFQQFADYIESRTPYGFYWSDWLKPNKVRRNFKKSIVVSIHASALNRSYPLPLSLYDALKEYRKEYDIVAIGDGPSETKYKTFKELYSVVANADLVIGVDSGILAIALAFGVPSVALFGPTSREIIIDQFSLFHPIDCTVVTHNDNYPCSMPCNWSEAKGYGVKGHCKTMARCMAEMPLEKVMSVINRKISAK